MGLASGLRSHKGPASPPYSHGPYEQDQLTIFQKPAVDSYKRYVLEENFNQRPMKNASIGVNANLNFEILGTNVAEANVIHDSTRGAIQMKTAGAKDDQVIILPHLDTKQTAWTDVLWGTENQVIWEAVIRTGASIEDVIIWAGLKLTNTPTVATDDDAAYFRFDGGVDNWEATTSIGGTDVEQDTGVAVSANTNYYFRIEIDSDRKAHFFIDNKEVYISTALTNDVDLIPYVGIQYTGSAGSTSKYLYLVKEKISRIIYE